MPGFDIGKLVSGFAKTAADRAGKVAEKAADNSIRQSGNQLPEYEKLANAGNQWALQRVRPDSYKSYANSLSMEKDRKARNASDGIHEISGYDPDLVDGHLAALDKWNTARDKLANEYNNNPMRVQRGANMARAQGNFGADLTVDQDKLNYKDDSGWNREYGEYERRLTDMEGNAHTTPTQFLGLTTQQLTPAEPRAVYEDLFSEWDESGYRNEDGLTSKFSNPELMDYGLIDDGYDPRSRQGYFMTGPQYIEYRKRGLPGRPIEEIDPSESAIYSKQSEAENYGFVPYLVDDKELSQYRQTAEQVFTSNVFDNLGQARRILSDYDIGYGGQEYSGKEFEDSFLKWIRSEGQKKNGNVVMSDPSDPNAIPKSMVMTDYNGERHVAPNTPQIIEQEDGSIAMIFGGDPDDDWYFDDMDDLHKSIQFYDASDKANGGPVVAWELDGPDPLTLPDGRQIRADEAKHIYDAISNPDAYQDVDFDFGFMGMGNPNVQYPSDGFLPWVTDMALSSAPYFWLPSSLAMAAGDTGMSSMGFRRGHNIQDDTYNLISEDPTLDQIAWPTAASAAMPLTERIWGSIGGMAAGGAPSQKIAGKVAEKVANRKTGNMSYAERAAYNDRLKYKMNTPFARWLWGSSDEGLEELPGNAVEELQANGLADWNADDKVVINPATGEVVVDPVTGEPELVHDSQRHREKVDTSLPKRALNYLIKDGGAPLAYFGGLTLGAGIGPTRIPAYRYEMERRYNPWIQDRFNERELLGYNTTIPDDPAEYDPDWRKKRASEIFGTRTLDDYVNEMRERQELIDAYQPIPWSLETAASRIADRYKSMMR